MTGRHDGKARPWHLAELTEAFSAQQRAHYDRLLTEYVRQIEMLPLDDGEKQQLVEFARVMLANDLDRCVREVAMLAARGLRTDEALH